MSQLCGSREIRESAIDNEDDDDRQGSDWESYVPSSDNISFQRVLSRPNITPLPSHLSQLFRENTDQTYLLRSTPDSIPRTRQSPNISPVISPAHSFKILEQPKPTSKTSPRKIKPRPMDTVRAQPLSPRTTRDKIVASELSETLRQQISLERRKTHKITLAASEKRYTPNNLTNATNATKTSQMHDDDGDAAEWYRYTERQAFYARGW